MGLSSSKCATRQCCQEPERPNSKTSEFCLIGSTSTEGSNVEQVSATKQCSSSCNSSAREALPESQQQIKQEALGSTEIRERRVPQPPRILSRTRQAYTDPLMRLRHNETGLENNPRILCRTMQVNTDSLTRFPSRESEAGHGQSSIEEIQARLRSYTGLSSSYMDMAHRSRQQVSDSTSPRRMIDSTSADTTSRYNSTGVLPSHRGRTGLAMAGEIDGYSICETAASSQQSRRLASGPSRYAEFPTLRGESTGRESRRNGGRRFWDALTRAASQRRLSNYQENREAAGRVLVPCNGRSAVPNRRVDTIAPSIEERGRNVFRNRSLNLDERRRRFRSQVWALQRLSTSLESVPGHARPCIRRVHHEPVEQSYGAPQSSTEETDTRASISRIIMLAEALFQVLDEIHRQSLALTQSTGLSLGALRAPDAVVNSMPLRVFQKVDNVEMKEEAALQCHICLLEYEGGDHLRVLPCRHEFHMTCIDKWLREVHRICPLCRGDVCELTAMGK